MIKKKAPVKYESYDDKATSIPPNTSLVKYDTPFLVSTNLSNKNALEEFNDSNDKIIQFFKNIINKENKENEVNQIYIL